MSNEDKHSRSLSYSVVPSKKSTMQKIQPNNLNCNACHAVSVKILTDEDIKSPKLNRSVCVCAPAECSETCECKDIPTKMSAQDAIQLVHATCEDCKAFMLNNEEIHLSTVNFSSEAISISTEPDQSLSSNKEAHVACEGCATEMSPNEEIYSRSSLCNCQTMHAKMLNTEEINFSTPNLRSHQTLSPKPSFNQSQLPSYENTNASEGFSKNFLTVEEIHSRSNIIDSLLENMLTSENIKMVPQSSSNETLTKQLFSDSDYTIDQNPSPSCKTGVACELSTKMLINEAYPLQSLSFSNEALSTKTLSVLSQLFDCETKIDCEGCRCSTKMCTDEEVHSRSFSSDALLRNMSTIEDIQVVSQTSTKGALAKKVLSDSNHRIGQSQSSRSKTCIDCELPTKKLTNEVFPLAASSFSNEGVFKETSAQSQTLSGDAPIPNPPTDISTDEDSYSRSSVCEALLKKILSYDEIHLPPQSDSEQGQSLNHEMYTGGSQSLCGKGILLKKKCDTDSPIVQIRAMGALSPLDPSSYSRPELAIIKHISLNLNVDFEKHVLSGQAKIDFDVLQDINDLILDASKLKIESIEAEDGTQLQYKLGEHLANMGSKLTILLPQKLSAGEKHDEYTMTKVQDKDILSKPCPKDRKDPSEKFSTTLPLTFNGFVFEPTMGCSKDRTVLSREESSTCCDDNISATEYQGYRLSVKVKYSTDPQASALQWLDPEQTSGKKHPYLFSQCQPIHARSILPCQDTPAVKFTYDAEVSAPEEFTVLMSALRGEQKSTKTTFRQPMPLPSYLVALAVGVLESRTLGPRSKVWSEKEEIERSAWEFSETEKYLQAAEKLCGPYEWTQYDLLVLPPSFPYGGMENPCLTFVTPTLLAGDRSQADVIVHEIMHSWTGNLVTNRNFEHFWLNEGFTVFLERKVAASLINNSVEAKRSRDFHSLLGLQELNEAIEVFGSTNPLTNLVVDLQGIHPDDAFSRVPYEKGSLFLRYLEDLVGGPEVFDDFLRAYLTKFRKKSLDTEQFQKFFVQYFKDNEALKKIDWDKWLHTSGMPPIIPDYDTTMTKAISALIVKLDDPTATISYDDVATFTPQQMIHMLQQLIDRPALSLDRLTALGTEYKVNGNKNTEILYRWLRLCIRSRDHSKINEVFNFVNSQGRMKYVRPIYRDLYAWEDVRERAIDNFLKNEKYMMHVSAYTLRKDLHLEENNMTKE